MLRTREIQLTFQNTPRTTIVNVISLPHHRLPHSISLIKNEKQTILKQCKHQQQRKQQQKKKEIKRHRIRMKISEINTT